MMLLDALQRDVEEAYREASLLRQASGQTAPDYDSFVRGFVAGAVAAARHAMFDRRRPTVHDETHGDSRQEKGDRNVVSIAERRGVLPPRGSKW